MNPQYNFKKGAVEMLLLHILNSKGDCYGYQLSLLIQEISDKNLYIPEGSLYPALYKLMEENYISCYKKQTGKRMIKVYYHIEDSGKERLEILTKEYLATTSSIFKILNYDFQSEPEENTNE